MHTVAHQLLLGLRESLTIAGQVGEPVECVNAALHRLQAECDGCLVLTRPYGNEPRVVISVVGWDALKHAAGTSKRP
jgi:hypothetical protein